MSEAFKYDLKNARPQLKQIAPLTYSICWGYVVVNILIGIGMFFFYATTIPLAVANILSYQVWGVLFLATGIVSGCALLKNEWRTTRSLLLAGLTLKAIWAIALIIRCLSSPQTILITVVWLFFAYVQAVTYIYFLSKNPEQKNAMQ